MQRQAEFEVNLNDRMSSRPTAAVSKQTNKSRKQQQQQQNEVPVRTVGKYRGKEYGVENHHLALQGRVVG